jgi:hypothetical protein
VGEEILRGRSDDGVVKSEASGSHATGASRRRCMPVFSRSQAVGRARELALLDT